MDYAIHAAQHSALTLDLTSKALNETASIQKSEVVRMLGQLVDNIEHENETSTNPAPIKTTQTPSTPIVPKVPLLQPFRFTGTCPRLTDRKVPRMLKRIRMPY